MKRPVVLLPAASRDVAAIVARYRAGANTSVAAGFVAAFEKAVRHIGDFPDSGSTRLSAEAGIEGVRNWALDRYPFLVFYRPSSEKIEIWRVLHSHGDTLQALAPPSRH